MEIISERRNANGQAIYLDLWGVGKVHGWQAFYDPKALGDGSSCGCNDQTIAELTQEEKRSKKVPLSFVVPCEPGLNNWVYSNVVCAATFTDGPNGRGWDEVHLGVPPSGVSGSDDPVSLMFVRSRIIEYLHDPGEPCNVARIVNEYFSTACARVQKECSSQGQFNPNKPVNPRCELDGTTWRARRFTFLAGDLSFDALPPLPTPGTGTPTATPSACEGCPNTWCMVMREEYWVRRVPPENRLIGGEYRNTGGFGGFLWAGNPNCAVDECPYWYIDPVGGAATETPGPTPTPGPTNTPLPIEHEDWRTRCRKLGLDCTIATPEVWSFCGVPSPTPVVAEPDGGMDNRCDAPWTPESTPTPSRTAAPLPTAGARVAVPFPTDTGATCVPSPTPTSTPTSTHTSTPTPTPTLTFTPTPTLTPTLTPTPTLSPTPLPTCDTQTASRTCPPSGQNCLNGCLWSLPALTFADLACDTNPRYELTISAIECDAVSHISAVKVQWSLNGSDWLGWENMQGTGGSPKTWTYTHDTCLDFKPPFYQIKWWTNSSSIATKGIEHAAVTLCCEEVCP